MAIPPKSMVPRPGFTKARIKEIIQKKNIGLPCYVQRIMDNQEGKKELMTLPQLRTKGLSATNCCPIGAFIPENHYDPDMENKSPRTLFALWPSVKSLMPIDPRGMMALMAIHDEFITEERYFDDPRPALLNWVETYVQDDPQ